MDPVQILVGLILGLLIGGVAVFVLLSKKQSETKQVFEAKLQETETLRQKSELDAAKFSAHSERLPQLELERSELNEQAKALMEELTSFKSRESALEAQIAEREKANAEQKALLAMTEEKMREAFAAVSSDALAKNSTRFIELAQEKLNEQKGENQQELAKQKAEIDKLLKPLGDNLEKVTSHIKEIEEKRTTAYAGMDEMVKQVMAGQSELRKQTGSLVHALRTPIRRGQWGELQLRRVIELSGMINRCDFEEQTSTDTEAGRLRPDVIVNMPSQRQVIVDAKAPLEAYLQAVELTDEDQRKVLMLAHAKHIREHIKQLASKKYWDQFANSPDFVVMFLPGEPLFSAALEVDPELIEFAGTNKVMIATPMTLIAMLKAVYYGWQHVELEKEAIKIAKDGKDLYERLKVFADHMTKVGTHLSRAVGSYNDMVGSAESRVLSSARKMRDYSSLRVSDIEIDDIPTLAVTTRPISAPELQALPGFED